MRNQHGIKLGDAFLVQGWQQHARAGIKILTKPWPGIKDHVMVLRMQNHGKTLPDVQHLDA